MDSPIEATLFALEENFWRADRGFYDTNVADDGLMVFSDPVGVLDKQAATDSIAGGQRWTDVHFDDRRVVAISPDAVILTYRARARRGDQEPYSARASSAYVRRDGSWRLLFHQQTPS
jgi:hypothetical protein